MLVFLENDIYKMNVNYIRENFTMLIQHQNFISCIGKLNKNLDEEKAVSMLVVGTEQKNIFILEASGMSVKKQIDLKSVPCFLECTGQFDIDYRIYVACRDGRVYVIRNGELTDQCFTIETKPVGLILFEKQIVIAGMNNSLHSFYLKGKRNFNLIMPAPILDIVRLEVKRTQSTTTGQCIVVALSNGEIRLYNPKEKNLIHVLKTDVSDIRTIVNQFLGCNQRGKVWNIWKRRRKPHHQQ